MRAATQSVPVRTDVAEARVFFPNLDGLRFFAFFLVYLQHGFGGAIPLSDEAGLLRSSLHKAVFASGWAGVSFFFVLSGFLITYLLLSEVRLKGSVDVVAFYIRRMLRIWPLYYAVVLFGLVLYPALKSAFGFSSYLQVGRPIYYLLFLGNFDVINLGGDRGAMSLNITWSVAIEEQFYLVWPLFFFVIPPRFYKFIFPAVIAVSAAFRLANHNNGPVLYFHSLSVISDMAVGGLAAYLAFNSIPFTEFFGRLSRITIVAVYMFGASLMLFRTHIFVTPVVGMLERAVFATIFAFVLLEQCYARNSITKMRNWAIISKLGKYTYGLYLLHPICIIAVYDVWRMLIGTSITGWTSFGLGVLALLCTTALGFVSYELFEKKFLALKRHFTYIRSSPTVA
jgi:peptidoglycan/LPS O-acetylase OafA/YrhL